MHLLKRYRMVMCNVVRNVLMTIVKICLSFSGHCLSGLFSFLLQLLLVLVVFVLVSFVLFHFILSAMSEENELIENNDTFIGSAEQEGKIRLEFHHIKFQLNSIIESFYMKCKCKCHKCFVPDFDTFVRILMQMDGIREFYCELLWFDSLFTRLQNLYSEVFNYWAHGIGGAKITVEDLVKVQYIKEMLRSLVNGYREKCKKIIVLLFVQNC